MSALTIDHVAAIMPNARANGLDNEFVYMLDTLDRFEINTKQRLACFLANVAVESGELYYVREIADGSEYEGREDLGNTEPGDGARFAGRGYIQITGRNNYATVADGLAIGCLDEPELLERMPAAWLSAGYYWRYMSSWGNLNDYADAGDFDHTVLGVNGGYNGYDERLGYYNQAMQVLPDDLTIGGDVTEKQPTDWLAPDGNTWLVDSKGRFARVKDGVSVAVNGNGWLYAAEAKWQWPEANDDPIPDSASYQERHPTRYTWRDDVDAKARYLVDNYNVSCNTYYDHPEGYGRTEDSIDVWGPGGRNDPIDPALGQQLFSLLFNDPQTPNIEWIIWQKTIYGAWNNWGGEPFGDGSTFTNHDDHIHVTYLRG